MTYEKIVFEGNTEYGRKYSEPFIALHIKKLHELGGGQHLFIQQMFTECQSSMH